VHSTGRLGTVQHRDEQITANIIKIHQHLKFFIYFLHNKLAKDSETSRFGFFVFVFVGEQSIQVMNSQHVETQQTVSMRHHTDE